MMITLKTGLLHNDLQDKLFDDLTTSIKEDPLQTKVVLIGSNMLREHLEQLLVRQKVYPFNLKLVTFSQLFKDLELKSGKLALGKNLPLCGRELILLKILSELPGNHYFKKVDHKPGFLFSLCRAFSELQI